MKIGLYWYSAAGNTLKLARAAKEEWEGDGHDVSAVDMLTDPEPAACAPGIFDRVVFAFPVMVFKLPWAVEKFIEKLSRYDAPQTPVKGALLISYGGMPGATVSIAMEKLTLLGVDVRCAAEVRCEDSYIPLRKYMPLMSKKGKPDAESLKEARRFALKVTGELDEPCMPPKGVLRSLLSAATRNAPDTAGTLGLGERHLERQDCIKCSLCVRLCPSGALTGEGGELPALELSRCVGCLACFNNCPTTAWRLKRYQPKYFYHCEGESLAKGL